MLSSDLVEVIIDYIKELFRSRQLEVVVVVNLCPYGQIICTCVGVPGRQDRTEVVADGI